MKTHVAGALHADGYGAPAWLPVPDDVNALLPQLWSRNVERGVQGALTVAGHDVRDLAAEFGTPAFFLDENDFRSRAREFRDDFRHAFSSIGAECDVYYAGKAFLCTAVAKWIDEDGLFLDTASGTEMAIALRAGLQPERIALHGNNKSDDELREAITHGVGRIVVDSQEEIDQVSTLATELGKTAHVMIRVTVGVEAHTHSFIATAHEDQKFGISLSTGSARQAAVAAYNAPGIELRGLHSHIGSQIFDTAAFEVAARRLLSLHAELAEEFGQPLAELDLGGGYGIAYTSQDKPLTAKELADQMAGIVQSECVTAGVSIPHISIEPGRAIAGPSTFTLYTVGTTKNIELDGGTTRRYVSVDGGMSDNIRTALYDAEYSATLASRTSNAAPVLSRVVGKHCESGDIVVQHEFLPGDVNTGDLVAVPATGAYCRSMASNYNQIPRPPVIAVSREGVREIVRRETRDDLMRLDAG